MSEAPSLKHRLQYAALASLLGVLLALPYRWRVPLCGWVFSRIVAPLTGTRGAIRANLKRALPALPEAEVRRLLWAVPANVGRTLVELCSGTEFLAQAAKAPIEGDGMLAIREAQAEGRGVILVSGHFGNYDVPRAVMAAQGLPAGGIYQVPKNPLIHDRYRKLISVVGEPLFARGRRGTAGLVKHLKSGGIAGMLVDWHIDHGAELLFFGQPARTALSAAEMALKYNCLLIPVYGLRQADGLNFALVTCPPIEHGTPEAMTQALNDSLEQMTRAHLDQWFWSQPRWKDQDRLDRRRERRLARGLNPDEPPRGSRRARPSE